MAGSGRLEVFSALKPVGGVYSKSDCPKLAMMPPFVEPSSPASGVYSLLVIEISP